MPLLGDAAVGFARRSDAVGQVLPVEDEVDRVQEVIRQEVRYHTALLDDILPKLSGLARN